MSQPRPARFPLVLLGMGNVHRNLLRILDRKAGLVAERHGVTLPVVACADRSGFVLGPEGAGSALSRPAIHAAKDEGTPLTGIPGAAPLSLAEALDLAGPSGMLLDAASMDMDTGGIGLRAARAALARGQSVVFANKSAVALAFTELEETAARTGAGLGWSATVCGGLPVVNVGRGELVAARFRRVRGVFNSTSNLVLERMAAGRTLDEAIREAQERGIAETDPTNDLNGADSAAKLAIIARTVLDAPATFADVERRGIEAAEAPGPDEAVRLFGEAVPGPDGGFRLRVAPQTVPKASFFGGMGALDMAVEWETDIFGVQRLAATEGDAIPTAAAVLRDAVHIALGRPAGPTRRSAGRGESA